MKIIITESQLNELKARSENYLNQLLDKISKYGMKSLTDDEKEAMIKMSRGEDPEMDIEFVIKFWKSLMPQIFKKDVNNETWLISRIDTPLLILRIVNPEDGFTFYVCPFPDYQPIMRIKIGETNFDEPIEEHEIPRTKKEIDDFNYVFMQKMLPEIIKSVDTNFRNK